MWLRLCVYSRIFFNTLNTIQTIVTVKFDFQMAAVFKATIYFNEITPHMNFFLYAPLMS